LRHERDALRHERDAALADRDRLAAKLAAAGHRQEVEALRAALELARDEADRLRHNIGAADARHARLEADLVSLRADRDRVGAELAASRGAPGATRAPPGAASRAAQPTATLPALPVPVSRHHAQGRVTAPSRIGAPRAGAGLWAVRAVALLLVLALLAAVALLLVGVA
jgi:hypothetical protein